MPHDTPTRADRACVCPCAAQVYYSTNWYTERAVNIIQNHTTVAPDQPLWVHLMYQGVHSPYVSPPPWEVVNDTHGMSWPAHPFVDMLSVVDTGFANITSTIRAVPGLWYEPAPCCGRPHYSPG